eukprot:11942071-Karenia_brevis.AAC.1
MRGVMPRLVEAQFRVIPPPGCIDGANFPSQGPAKESILSRLFVDVFGSIFGGPCGSSGAG